MARYIVIFALAYLIGAIPFGFIFYWLYEKKDIRRVGSGNIGATNVTRSLGILKGILVLLLDMLKGVIAVYLAQWILGDIRWISIAGLIAIAGHMFPIYLGFRGGKGVATWIGVFLVLAPHGLILSLVLFFIAVLLTRYISLGSITAAISLPFILLILDAESALVLTAIISAFLIVLKHRGNISKILNGTENKFAFHKNKEKACC